MGNVGALFKPRGRGARSKFRDLFQESLLIAAERHFQAT